MAPDPAAEVIEIERISKPLADDLSSTDGESTASGPDSEATTEGEAEGLTGPSTDDSNAEGQDERAHLRRQQEALRLQREAEETASRESEELERRFAEEQRAKEESAARERLNTWMRRNGFEGMRARKRLSVSAPYPLHRAVKQNDSAMVQLLLKFGADHSATNMWNLTPRQLADKLNKNDSHSEVLAVLPAA